jgi:hypothetical protein
MNEGKSARSRRVGRGRRVCGVARLGRSTHYGPAPRALHPLPPPANAAHAEYSDRLQASPCWLPAVRLKFRAVSRF